MKLSDELIDKVRAHKFGNTNEEANYLAKLLTELKRNRKELRSVKARLAKIYQWCYDEMDDDYIPPWDK